jgi:glycosyltransferase involved in cell wall biosynthesis
LSILVVTTKAPWPAVDGGRLVVLNTIAALAAAGHDVELVAPFPGPDELRRRVDAALRDCCTPHLVAAAPHSAAAAALIGLSRGMPVTVARHSLAAVRRQVAELVDARSFDVVHAEQLHALPQTAPARQRGVPVVHRAHNVESMIWAYSALHRGPAVRACFAFEARRVSVWEVRAIESADATIALTDSDRRALSELVPAALIPTIPAPFARDLQPGDARLEGEPAVVTLVSPSWTPSRDAVGELVRTVWPGVRRRLPGAVLHVFGAPAAAGSSPGVVFHPAPADSRDAFPAGAVALVPARHPTGVPIKALEAWARGLPLVVDGATAEALGAVDGVEVVIAAGATGYATALARLAEEDGLAQRIVGGGRRALAERHDPAKIADSLVKVYRWAAAKAGGAG